MMRLIGSEKILIAISLLFCLSSCCRVPKEIHPKINYCVQDRYLKQLPSPFAKLSQGERDSQWGAEYLIGISFARNLDFYRAITAFRRAEILIPEEKKGRKLEIQYEILLCYYFGRRYEEVEETFNQSDLAKVSTDFPAFHDLLVVLYDTYQQLEEWEKQCHVLKMIYQYYPETYHFLVLSSVMESADFEGMKQLSQCPPEKPYLNGLLNCYEANKKSPTTAAFLNAVIPGTGYLYLGQRQTAFTAFVFNGLFIASSVYFFKKGPIAAGIVTTSFEAGWYFGGIYGGAYEAKFYNERLYERMANPVMNREGLFPIFRLNYAF